MTRLREEPGGKAYSFEGSLPEIRQKVLAHEEYGPHLNLKRDGDGKLRLMELHAEDGTSERGKKANQIYIQLVGWPTLRKPNGELTITSSHFRVPVTMGRFKEKRDILYEHYEHHSARLAEETTIYSQRHQVRFSFIHSFIHSFIYPFIHSFILRLRFPNLV